MKSARIIIFANQYKNAPKQPDGKGIIELPATLIMELAQLVQTGQFTGTNQQTAEPFVQLSCSCWRGDGTVGPQGGITVMSGQIESPSERAAYLASKQQGAQQQPQSAWGGPATAPAQQGWGSPAAAAQGWGQPPAPQPAPQQWAAPAAPHPHYQQAAPEAAPQQAPTAQPGF